MEQGLGKFYDDLIIAATTQELIDAALLVPPVVFAPSAPDLSEVHTVAGEFNQHELADACETAMLVGDVIETWPQRADGLATLCYGIDRPHAEHLQQRFIEAGVAAEYMDCFTDSATRERIFARFRAGQTRVICNVGVLTTGVDFDVRCIIDAHPTRSEILFVQTVGRGLRTAPGKDKLIVLDHAGNHLRLGLVTDIHHEHLDDGRERHCGERGERSAPLPKLCANCACVLPARALRCEQCGTPVETRCAIEASDEELVPLGMRAPPRTPGHAEKMDFMGELKWIADERGYSQGWCAHKFKEKFGHWPNDSSIRSCSPRAAGTQGPAMGEVAHHRLRQVAGDATCPSIIRPDARRPAAGLCSCTNISRAPTPGSDYPLSPDARGWKSTSSTTARTTESSRYRRGYWRTGWIFVRLPRQKRFETLSTGDFSTA